MVEAARLRFWVGVTDNRWFEFLSRQVDLEEVNFWRPTDQTVFRGLEPGGFFLFKLHAPSNYIAGGGFFLHWRKLRLSLAWDAFGKGNGAASFEDFRRLIDAHRTDPGDRLRDYEIGCVILSRPFFLPRDCWVSMSGRWGQGIMKGKGYYYETAEGTSLWHDVQQALLASDVRVELPSDTTPAERFAKPVLVTPRLGQGGFRVLVTEAYDYRCAVTRERTLPALEVAHIVPYSEGGEHRVENGLLLRRDLHALFDRGLVTVTPQHELEVSARIKEEYENGHEYYAMRGRLRNLPHDRRLAPSPEFLRWHNENLFRP